ncbi:hypothetical protein [Agrobacterium tumefaciens]|uniref:hypothetical protein n=1 Tax=Agrobacterium tumefaciens TaxID=358 RepID=UPI0013AEA73D|nr:hypothetical protein [Agrobacterium tumefaciens]MCP2132959.1 hypothetical protein [Rhizobium sp. SLBN-94]
MQTSQINNRLEKLVKWRVSKMKMLTGKKQKKLNIIAAKLVELAAAALLPEVTFPAVVFEAVLPSAGPGAVRTTPT